MPPPPQSPQRLQCHFEQHALGTNTRPVNSDEPPPAVRGHVRRYERYSGTTLPGQKHELMCEHPHNGIRSIVQRCNRQLGPRTCARAAGSAEVRDDQRLVAGNLLWYKLQLRSKRICVAKLRKHGAVDSSEKRNAGTEQDSVRQVAWLVGISGDRNYNLTVALVSSPRTICDGSERTNSAVTGGARSRAARPLARSQQVLR